MLTIMKQDTINLLKNKPIMMYLLIYPVVLILVTGFVFGSIFSDDILTSYDYYGVTMMIYLSMATVIILPELLFGSNVKYANYRIVYSPIPRYKIYLSKLIVSISISYFILAIYPSNANGSTASRMIGQPGCRNDCAISPWGMRSSFWRCFLCVTKKRRYCNKNFKFSY